VLYLKKLAFLQVECKDKKRNQKMKVHGHGQAKILTGTEIDNLLSEGFATARDRALFGFCLYTGCDNDLIPLANPEKKKRVP